MRARKASVSAVEVTSPRAIRLRASAMLSVVRAEVLRLLIGGEHVRRLGGPGPTGGNALQQGEQAGITLVQVLDVLRRGWQAGQRGACTKFFKRWWFLLGHPILPASNMQSTCREAEPTALAWGLHAPPRRPLLEAPNSGALNVQAPSRRCGRNRSFRRDCNPCLLARHSAHRHDSRRPSPHAGPARPRLPRFPLRRLHDLRRAGELGSVEG